MKDIVADNHLTYQCFQEKLSNSIMVEEEDFFCFSSDDSVHVYYVTASSYRSLNALTEVEEPAGMGESLGTGAHRHRSILLPGVEYVSGPWMLRRIL